MPHPRPVLSLVAIQAALSGVCCPRCSLAIPRTAAPGTPENAQDQKKKTVALRACLHKIRV